MLLFATEPIIELTVISDSAIGLMLDTEAIALCRFREKLSI
jgi:hypothetical protein